MQNGTVWILLTFCVLLVIGACLLIVRLHQTREPFEDASMPVAAEEGEQTLGEEYERMPIPDPPQEELKIDDSAYVFPSSDVDEGVLKMLAHVDDIGVMSGLADPRIIMEIQDIPLNEAAPSFDTADIVVPSPSELEEDATKIGDPTWIYFVPRHLIQSCDNNTLRKPDFWFNMPKNRAALNNPIMKDMINTTCKYRLSDWRSLYQGEQKGFVVTQETRELRGDPRDWMRVVQRATGPARNTNALVQDIERVQLEDGNDYWQASVNSIRGPEIHAKVCPGTTIRPVMLPAGMFLALTGFPVREWAVFNNNAPVNLTVSNMHPFVAMFREQKEVSGAVENLYFTPAVQTLQVFIYMKELCGSSLLYRQVTINFQFSKRILVKSSSDPNTKGNRAELEARIRSFLQAINTADENIRILNRERDRQISNAWNTYYRMVNQDRNEEYNRSVRWAQQLYDQRMDRGQYQRRENNWWCRLRRRCGWLFDEGAWRQNNAIWEPWLNRQKGAATEVWHRRGREAKAWIDRMPGEIRANYARLVANQETLKSNYHTQIQRIRAVIDQIDPTMLQLIRQLLGERAYAITSRSSDPQYRNVEDLYSAEQSDNRGRPIEGTARMYIKIT
jgi:hypothetical protein